MRPWQHPCTCLARLGMAYCVRAAGCWMRCSSSSCSEQSCGAGRAHQVKSPGGMPHPGRLGLAGGCARLAT
ncbi:hypothetical protein GGR57DRAFT_455781 [Xylariaceae sp. FL1272]|nr:hypothetical protein GGR57DRAFT_455781 [Xylariaceae sp. FL1272]